MKIFEWILMPEVFSSSLELYLLSYEPHRLSYPTESGNIFHSFFLSNQLLSTWPFLSNTASK